MVKLELRGSQLTSPSEKILKNVSILRNKKPPQESTEIISQGSTLKMTNNKNISAHLNLSLSYAHTHIPTQSLASKAFKPEPPKQTHCFHLLGVEEHNKFQNSIIDHCDR